jgi:hypothetical protein
MMATDAWIHGWLGPAADLLHYPVPIALATVLTALGWWLSHRERRLRVKLERIP